MLHIGRFVLPSIVRNTKTQLIDLIKTKMSAIDRIISKNQICEDYLASLKNEVINELVLLDILKKTNLVKISAASS